MSSLLTFNFYLLKSYSKECNISTSSSNYARKKNYDKRRNIYIIF